MTFEFLESKVYLFLGVLLAVSLLVILAIMLDLWDGLHTAKKTAQPIRSSILRITVAKICEYWRFILVGFLVDCLGILFSFYGIPFITVLFGAGLIAVETKSMFEHAKRRKSRSGELPAIIHDIINCLHEHEAKDIVKRLTADIEQKQSLKKGESYDE